MKWELNQVLSPKLNSRFKKDFKKYQHNQTIIDELDKIIGLLRDKKKLPEKYKDHALSGDYVGFRECHVKPDVLLVYDFDDKFIYLIRLGSHSELF
ncbi:MAG: type II toxin-antitoxin system YafQ family toxin [Parachlamydiaceae bacterium]|nr:type II toxin-antitoxin system YafQ family toxin [Parachlamydiaceae bacterium]